MKKENGTFEDKLKRAKELAGIKPLHESRQGTSSTIEYNSKGKNGVNYSIVKEEGSYYIKSTKSDLINESTLDYIGGEKNKTHKYKYDSYSEALKNLNFMMIELNESYGVATEAFIEERLDKDLGSDDSALAPEGTPVGEPEQGMAPEQPVSPEPAPAEAPLPPVDQAPAPVAEPSMDGLADDDSDLEDGAEGGDSIDSYVGKLTAEIRKTGADQMGEDRIKSILNSVISALPLETVSPEERLIIARRIKRGGKKEAGEEDAPTEQPAPSPESQGEPSAEPVAPDALPPAPDEKEVEENIVIPVHEIAPLEAPTAQFDVNDDKHMNEFLGKLPKDKLVAEGGVLKFKNLILESKDNKLVLVNGEQSFTYNISESTFSKFNSLLKEKELIAENLTFAENTIKNIIKGL